MQKRPRRRAAEGTGHRVRSLEEVRGMAAPARAGDDSILDRAGLSFALTCEEVSRGPLTFKEYIIGQNQDRVQLHPLGKGLDFASCLLLHGQAHLTPGCPVALEGGGEDLRAVQNLGSLGKLPCWVSTLT